MINPDNKQIAVCASAEEDALSQKIRWHQIGGKQCCDFYSRFLIRSLRLVNSDWKTNHSYRIYGKIHSKENLAIFSMTDSFDIETSTVSETSADS